MRIILVVSFFVLFSCSYDAEKECAVPSKVFNVVDSLNIISIDTVEFVSDLKEYLCSGIRNDFSKDYGFFFDLEKEKFVSIKNGDDNIIFIPLKRYFCGKIYYRSDEILSIAIPEEEKVLINLEDSTFEIKHTSEVGAILQDYYERVGFLKLGDLKPAFFIDLGDSVKISSSQEMIAEVSLAYINFLKKKSGKDICALSSVELVQLKKEYPFSIKFDSYLPPPPQELLNPKFIDLDSIE